MSEQTFLSENGITISNARFITPGQTYAMSGVTSVKSLRKNPSRKAPIILGIIGLIAMVAGDTGIIVGVLLIAASIAWWVLNKATFTVVLSSASGEAQAYTSKDSQFITRVVNALNEAIVARG